MATWPWTMTSIEQEAEKKPENLIELFDKWDRETHQITWWTSGVSGIAGSSVTAGSFIQHAQSQLGHGHAQMGQQLQQSMFSAQGAGGGAGTIIHYQGQAPTITTHCPHCKKTI